VKVKIKTPKAKLEYNPPAKVDYKTTSFRLPADQLKELENWVEESADDSDSGSVNDLVRQIIKWALENKEARK